MYKVRIKCLENQPNDVIVDLILNFLPEQGWNLYFYFLTSNSTPPSIAQTPYPLL